MIKSIIGGLFIVLSLGGFIYIGLQLVSLKGMALWLTIACIVIGGIGMYLIGQSSQQGKLEELQQKLREVNKAIDDKIEEGINLYKKGQKQAEQSLNNGADAH